MSVSSRPSSVLRTITLRPYCWLWLGELASGSAIIALTSALALEVNQRTHNAGLVALIVALVALPVLALSPVVVPLTARLGVGNTLWSSQVVMAVATTVAAFCIQHDIGGLWPGYLLVVIIGSANAFHVPALFTSLSWFVGEYRVPQGISSFSVRTVLTWILGPLVVAVIGTSHRGADLAWWSAFALLIAAAPTIALHGRFTRHEEALRAREALEPGCVRQAIADGVADYDLRNVCMLSQAASPYDRRLRALWRDSTIRYLMCSYGVLYTLLGAFSVVLIPWATRQLGTTATIAASLVAVRSVAALPGPLVAGRAVRCLGMSAVLVAAALIGATASVIAAYQHAVNTVAVGALIVYGAVFYVLTSGTFATLVTIVVGAEQRTEGAAMFALVRAVVSVLFVAIGLLAKPVGTQTVLVWCGAASAVWVAVMRFGTQRRWSTLMQRYLSNR